jgi:hypothetical protein
MNDNSKLAKPVRQLTSLVRPKYSPGLLLQDDDLTTGVSYTRNLNRLMFRTLFGCGVLCGLTVTAPRLKCGKVTVDVAKGVALSCAGDPIEVPATQEITLDPCGEQVPTQLWVAVKHIEVCCVPRTAQCPPDEDEPPSTCTRDRDGFELRVFAERPPCSCGCAALAPTPSQPAPPPPPPPPASKPKAKGGNVILTDPIKVDHTGGEKVVAGGTAAHVLANTGSSAAEIQESPLPSGSDPCLCTQRTEASKTDPQDPTKTLSIEGCYFPFYDGQCACDCCDCDWIILAVATQANNEWSVDHSVRRFVRPVLMRDPQVAKERATTGA